MQSHSNLQYTKTKINLKKEDKNLEFEFPLLLSGFIFQSFLHVYVDHYRSFLLSFTASDLDFGSKEIYFYQLCILGYGIRIVSPLLLAWQHDLDVTQLRHMEVHARLVELHLFNYGRLSGELL